MEKSNRPDMKAAVDAAFGAFATEAESLIETEKALDRGEFEKAVKMLAGAERIAASGCGHSGICCMHFCHLMCCIERPARFISPAEAPHGALGNLCQYDREASRAIVEAVYEIDPELIIYYCAGAVLGEEAVKIGLQAKAEIFADRAYMDDLSLVPRKEEGSMITDENIAIDRCVRMVKEGKVIARSGKELSISGDTLCVHGDGPKALAFVQKIRDRFQKEGIEIVSFQKR